jgi:hypothetical protein
MTRILAALSALALSALSPLPQTRAQPAPPPSGAVSGIVLSADTGLPIRKGQVRLVSTTPPVTRTAATDAEGRFVLTGVPAGSYAVSASKPGYLEMVLGASRPGASMAGRQIQVVASQRVENLELKLPRGSVITGTITDEFGDPAFNTAVRVMRFVYSNGRRYATTFGQQDLTDDRGAYRIAGLMPGDYIVSAVPRDVVSQTMAAREMQRERFAAAQAAARAAGNATPLGMRPDAAELLSRPIDPRGYVPVHFPGSVLPGNATAVQVGPGAEVGGIDIRLEVVHTATVTGAITWTEGAVPGGARVQLLDPAMPMPTLGSWWTGLQPGAKFSFYGVVPGSYLLRVHTSAGGADLFAFTEIQVSPGVANEVELRLQRGMTIAGTVALGGAPIALSRLRVILHPVVTDADPELGMERVALDAEGRFAFRGIVPARYRFSFEGLPAGWSLGSAMFGDRDAADYLLEVEAGQNMTGGVLKLTSKSAEISGAVTTTTGQPITTGLVLVFPEDPRLWLPQSRRIHHVPLSVEGRYAVRGLPPGDYRVAIADPEPDQWFDAEYLTQLLGVAVRVALAEGEKKQQDMRVR